MVRKEVSPQSIQENYSEIDEVSSKRECDTNKIT